MRLLPVWFCLPSWSCFYWRPVSHLKPLLFSTAVPHWLPDMQRCPLLAHTPSRSWSPDLHVGPQGSQGQGAWRMLRAGADSRHTEMGGRETVIEELKEELCFDKKALMKIKVCTIEK